MHGTQNYEIIISAEIDFASRILPRVRGRTVSREDEFFTQFARINKHFHLVKFLGSNGENGNSAPPSCELIIPTFNAVPLDQPEASV